MKKRNGIFFLNSVPFLYRGIVAYIFFLISCTFLLMAAVSTSFIDVKEKIYFLPDCLWANIACFAATLSLTVAMIKAPKGRLRAFCAHLESDEKFFIKIRFILLTALWLSLSVWTICTQMPPSADQKQLLSAAEALLQRDFSMQSPIVYLYCYGHQEGLALLEMPLVWLFGDYCHVAFQLLNSIFIPLIYKNLSELAGLFGLNRCRQLVVIIVCVMFMPIALYVSFVYGTIPGILLAVLGIKYEILYFREGGWRHAFAVAVSISFAVLVKKNFLIFLIGVLIYAVVEIIRSKNLKKFLIVILTLFFYSIASTIPKTIVEDMRGEAFPEGISNWAWVAMGLQDDTTAGWWNGYNYDTFEHSGYNKTVQEIWVKEDVKTRVRIFQEDMDYARDFFVRKTASQWNEPSFQSIWILQRRNTGSGFDWPMLLTSPRGNHNVTVYLNYLNFALLAGVMLYLVFYSEDEYFHESLLPIMIVIGGFVFHMVWEAKGQYTLPYFILLLPYAVMGYSKAAERLLLLPDAVKSGNLRIEKKVVGIKIGLLVAALAILWYVFHGTLGSITGDAEAYYAYLAANS